jgi:hypothetical protein
MKGWRSSLAIYGGIAVVAYLLLTIFGVSALSALLLLIVVGVQVITGGYWWRLLQSHRSISPIELLGMGLAIGTAGAMLSGVLFFPLRLGVWAWVVPSIAAAILWLVRLARGQRTKPDARVTAPALAALIIGGALGVASFVVNVASYPLVWTGIWDRYHPDMLFFEALSNSVSTFGPGESIFMAGADIRYHWFTYAWAGQVAAAGGADSFIALTRVLPLVAIIGTVCIAIAWSVRLSRVPWVPTLSAALLISGGYVGATYGTILNFDSPSQSLSTVWLLGLSLALMAILNRRTSSVMLIVIAAFVCVLAGGKISSAIVVAGGFGLVIIVGLLRRQWWRYRALWAGVISICVLVITYVLVDAGSAEAGGLQLFQLLDKASSVQGLNPVDTPRGIIAGTIILILAMVPRCAGLLWLIAAPSSRWHRTTIFGVGLAIVGVLTVLLISGGLNDTWFALAASAPLSVLSAAGIGRAVQSVAPSNKPLPRPIIWVAVLVGLALSVFVASLWSTSTGAPAPLRWAGPIIGLLGALVGGLILANARGLKGRFGVRAFALTLVILVVMAVPARALGVGVADFGAQPQVALTTLTFTPFTQFVESIDNTLLREISSDQIAAAKWLRANSTTQQVVATNLTYSPIVPALIDRQMLIAGLQYQAPYGRPDQLQPLLAREAASWAFIDEPTSQTLAPLCAAGVDWVWVETARTSVSTWEPLASIAFATPDTAILRINPSAC